MHAVAAFRLSSEGWTVANEQPDQSVRNFDDSTFQYLLLQQDLFEDEGQLPYGLSQHFRIPHHLFSDVYRRSNGYLAFRESIDNEGNSNTCYFWFRILVKIIPQSKGLTYKWHEMTFCYRWTPARAAILCFGADPLFQSLLHEHVCRMWPDLNHGTPLRLLVPLLEAIVGMYDQSIWSIRDIIRDIEKNRLRPTRGPHDFLRLHEIGRHATHSSETLSVSVGTVTSLHQRCSAILNQRAHLDTSARTAQETILLQIESQIQMLQNLLGRSNSNKERLQNEIGLAFNMITQRDSQVMCMLGEDSRRDSRAMRTIAVVTMAFLPPTFLSAIFSMSFFNFSPAQDGKDAKWSVSGMFWVYWAIAIPLTLATLGIWLWRQRRTEGKKKME